VISQTKPKQLTAFCKFGSHTSVTVFGLMPMLFALKAGLAFDIKALSPRFFTKKSNCLHYLNSKKKAEKRIP